MIGDTVVLTGAIRVSFKDILAAVEEATTTLPAGVLTEWDAERLASSAEVIRRRHRQEVPKEPK